MSKTNPLSIDFWRFCYLLIQVDSVSCWGLGTLPSSVIAGPEIYLAPEPWMEGYHNHVTSKTTWNLPKWTVPKVIGIWY